MVRDGDSMGSINDKDLADFLTSCKTIAVVGLSADPHKASYVVASYLQSQGYEIVPVNPNARIVLGRKCVERLRDVVETIDIVDVFRPADEAPQIIEDAIAIGAKAVWLQSGITNEQAEQQGKNAGLLVISNRCLMKEHQRLLARAQL